MEGLAAGNWTRDGAAEERKNWTALLCVVLIFVGVLGNSLVALAISTEKRLQNTTNYFLLSLAIVDLLVSLLVMPLSIHYEFHGGRVSTGFGVCLFQVYSDVLLCSASIVHMSVIALDRYLGISRPLRLRAVTAAAVLVKICLVWVIAFAISCPIAILALVHPPNIWRPEVGCGVFNSTYQICGSILAFFIPLFIMIIAYVRTTKLLSQQALLCQRTDDRGLRRTMTRSKRRRKTSRNEPVSETNVCLTHYYMGNVQLGECFQVPEENAHIHALLAMHILQTTKGIQLPPMPEDEDVLGDLANLRTKFKERTANILRLVRKNNAAEVANEQKATRVLGLVFAVFFICWFPFFSTNVIMASCTLSGAPSLGTCAWLQPSPRLISLFVWLGYLSSVANPLIYTVFNAQFRSAFYRLIRCRIIVDGQYGSRRNTLNGSKFHGSERRRIPSSQPVPTITGSAQSSARNGGLSHQTTGTTEDGDSSHAPSSALLNPTDC